MNHQRRDALKAAGGLGVFGLLAAIGFIRPELAHAARNEAAFSAKSLDAVVAALGATTPTESGGILISAPDIAEDGAAVPVGVLSTLPGTDQIVIMVEKNLNMVAAFFVIASGTMADVQTSIKMGQTSNVLAMVRADGKYFVAKREVRVTLGGCGG